MNTLADENLMLYLLATYVDRALHVQNMLLLDHQAGQTNSVALQASCPATMECWIYKSINQSTVVVIFIKQSVFKSVNESVSMSIKFKQSINLAVY